MTASPSRATRTVVNCEWSADRGALAEDVLDELTRQFEEFPFKHQSHFKHLCDARGSELVDAICAQPEYYRERTERRITEARTPAIVSLAGACELLELGSGSASPWARFATTSSLDPA